MSLTGLCEQPVNELVWGWGAVGKGPSLVLCALGPQEGVEERVPGLEVAVLDPGQNTLGPLPGPAWVSTGWLFLFDGVSISISQGDGRRRHLPSLGRGLSPVPRQGQGWHCHFSLPATGVDLTCA